MRALVLISEKEEGIPRWECATWSEEHMYLWNSYIFKGDKKPTQSFNKSGDVDRRFDELILTIMGYVSFSCVFCEFSKLSKIEIDWLCQFLYVYWEFDQVFINGRKVSLPIFGSSLHHYQVNINLCIFMLLYDYLYGIGTNLSISLWIFIGQ